MSFFIFWWSFSLLELSNEPSYSVVSIFIGEVRSASHNGFYLWNRASIRRCADPSRWVISVTALSRVDDEGTLESALEEPG